MKKVLFLLAALVALLLVSGCKSTPDVHFSFGDITVTQSGKLAGEAYADAVIAAKSVGNVEVVTNPTPLEQDIIDEVSALVYSKIPAVVSEDVVGWVAVFTSKHEYKAVFWVGPGKNPAVTLVKSGVLKKPKK